MFGNPASINLPGAVSPHVTLPSKSGTFVPITAKSSGYAPRALEKGSGPGADQVAHGLIYRAIFFGGGDLTGCIELEVAISCTSSSSQRSPHSTSVTFKNAIS